MTHTQHARLARSPICAGHVCEEGPRPGPMGETLHWVGFGIHCLSCGRSLQGCYTYIVLLLVNGKTCFMAVRKCNLSIEDDGSGQHKVEAGTCILPCFVTAPLLKKLTWAASASSPLNSAHGKRRSNKWCGPTFVRNLSDLDH